MKLVQCKIILHTVTEYQSLVDALLKVFISHEARYDAPRGFTVFVACSHIMAEKNLDQILESMHLQCIKTPVAVPERFPVVFVSPSTKGSPPASA